MAKRHALSKLPNVRWLRRSGAPRHTLGYVASHKVFTGITAGIVAVLAFVGTFAGAVYADMATTVKNQGVAVVPQKHHHHYVEPLPIDPYANTPIDILLLGQDTRDGEANAALGGDDGSLAGEHNSDTAMVLQIAADRSYVQMVSIPRDSLVDVPSCETSHGTIPARYNVMFNSIFAEGYQVGGDVASAASCTMNAVNALTGLNIQNFMVVDFGGLVDMINAIGGVDVCIPMDTWDGYTGLRLSRGLHHLDGVQATQFARMRHGTGTDGSDMMRTTRQQYLMRKLIKEALSKNYVTHTNQLYQLAKSAIQSVQMSQNLADTMTLAGLAVSLKNFNLAHLYTQTVPVVGAPSDPMRVVWSSTADGLWGKMRNHQPIVDQQVADAAGGPAQNGSNGQKGQANGKNGSSSGSNTNGASNGADANANGAANGSDANAQAVQGIDPNTGLSQTNGVLIDPKTGGTVDADTGEIHDPVTGAFIGLADRYIDYTVCGIGK